jgi:hypothetical protein
MKEWEMGFRISSINIFLDQGMKEEEISIVRISSTSFKPIS